MFGIMVIVISFTHVLGVLAFVNVLTMVLICGILSVMVAGVVWAVIALVRWILPAMKSDVRDAKKLEFWRMLSVVMVTTTIFSLLLEIASAGSGALLVSMTLPIVVSLTCCAFLNKLEYRVS